MKPLCPACNEPMNKQGRGFECEGCRQIIVYFSVSDASPYFPAILRMPASPVFGRTDSVKQQVFHFARARTVGNGLLQSPDGEEDIGPEGVVCDQVGRQCNLRCPRQVRIIGLRTSLKQKLVHFTCDHFLRADHSRRRLAFLYDREMSH